MADFLLCEFLNNILATFFNVIKVNEDWTLKVTYDQVWWPILGICALHLSHPRWTAVNTHTHVNTHPEQWAAIYAAAPREQLGARCLDQGHLIVELRVERALYIHSIHLQFLPARDSNPQPFDYKSNSLTIRPRLPHDCSPWRFEFTSDSNLSHSFWLNYLVATVKIPMQGKINNESFLFISHKDIRRLVRKSYGALLWTWEVTKKPLIHVHYSLDMCSKENKIIKTWGSVNDDSIFIYGCMLSSMLMNHCCLFYNFPDQTNCAEGQIPFYVSDIARKHRNVWKMHKLGSFVVLYV